MDTLKNILIETLQGYTGKGLVGESVLSTSTNEDFFTVTTVASNAKMHIVNQSLVVRLDGTMIVILEDINDKPLADALVQNGVAREQIILAYSGEPIPMKE